MRTLRNRSWQRCRNGGVVALIGIVLALKWLSVPALAVEIAEQFLIVDGAQNVEEHHFDPTYWQISYTMDVEFPWLAVDEPQWQQLEDAGWARCQDRSSKWESYLDASDTPTRIIHQHGSKWIKGNRIITVVLRYYSSARDDTLDSMPDNTSQRVFLLFDEDVKGHDTIRWLDLECP